MCCCKVNSGSVRAKGPPNLCVERRTQTFCKSVNRSLGTKSIIHLPHTCNATQWAIKLLNSQLGFFFLFFNIIIIIIHSFIQGTRIAFISQPLCSVSSHARQGGLEPGTPPHLSMGGETDGSRCYWVKRSKSLLMVMLLKEMHSKQQGPRVACLATASD